MKKIFFIIIFIIFSLNSCFLIYDEEFCEDYNYSDCDTYEPYSFDMEIVISSRSEGVPVWFYSGNVENGTLLFADTVYSTFYEEVIFGGEYSIKAEYKEGDKIIFAVDGCKPTKRSTNKCDSVCWTSSHCDLDVSLIY